MWCVMRASVRLQPTRLYLWQLHSLTYSTYYKLLLRYYVSYAVWCLLCKKYQARVENMPATLHTALYYNIEHTHIPWSKRAASFAHGKSRATTWPSFDDRSWCNFFVLVSTASHCVRDRELLKTAPVLHVVSLYANKGQNIVNKDKCWQSCPISPRPCKPSRTLAAPTYVFATKSEIPLKCCKTM